ncbi:Basic region leucine zipper [Legionella lansingensis]|uniref:X-box-binding protein 1 n=1 Tax=Legionella lansingensis TaxID=45067 RepID=A0A0W0VNA6_9GAMM|nr:bZIP transcription factor [Legionella lansingensis]KTD21405.1 Basic region leucine zipper [Legionella lansingensis]SNV51920.1 Basic region leucine zipper [Legionella lansingensis]
MLEFYKKQLDCQELLKSVLSSTDFPNEVHESLFFLIEQQRERLKRLIASLTEGFEVDSKALLNEYVATYHNQERLMKTVWGELTEVWLPPLNAPTMDCNKTKDFVDNFEVIEESSVPEFLNPLPVIGGQEFSLPFVAPTSYTGAFFQQPPTSKSPVLPPTLTTSAMLPSDDVHMHKKRKRGSERASLEENTLQLAQLQTRKEAGEKLTDPEKKEFRRLRNLFAAKASREKRKTHTQQLERTYAELSEENKQLENDCIWLETENRILREELNADLKLLSWISTHIGPASSESQRLFQEQLRAVLLRFSMNPSATPEELRGAFTPK